MLLPVTMGSQQQQLPVILDTGSTVPYVYGFNFKESNTFTNLSIPGNLSYGGGAVVKGFYCTDTVSVSNITTKTFEFMVTNNDPGSGTPSDFSDSKGQGLFGFALGSYRMPGSNLTSNQVSTWRQLSTTAGLAGTRRNFYGLWLLNDNKMLMKPIDFGGMPDRWTTSSGPLMMTQLTSLCE